MKTAILISGGVDSSVALRLLQAQGHNLTAFYLKIWLEDELSHLGNCPWQEDLDYVSKVCNQAGVPLEIISLQKEYHDQVVSYTISEIKAGRTPNPDILCNARIKFGAFYDKIDNSFKYVATGHYAQKKEINDQAYLITSPDIIKDQTYFLSHLSQEQLKRALFPIGHLQKEDVRKLAQEFNLPNKSRKDSQGICFLGKLKFSEFIKYHLSEKIGSLIELETGKKIGNHLGFWYYTIGQRQGLGMAGGPWYVVSKNIEENIVFISKNYYSPDKIRDNFCVANCSWINNGPAETDLIALLQSCSNSSTHFHHRSSSYGEQSGRSVCRSFSQDGADGDIIYVKIRHGANIYQANISMLNNNKYHVKLNGQDQGIAPGQFAVFYEKISDKEFICLGSGVIE